MSGQRAPDEEQRQYGVQYPDGRTFWVTGKSSGVTLPGSYGLESLASAQERGKFTDSWRLQVAGLGLVPDDVPSPKFVSRVIITKFGDAAPVVDA